METQQCPVCDFSVSPARLVPNAVSGSGVRAKLERRQSEARAKAERTLRKVRAEKACLLCRAQATSSKDKAEIRHSGPSTRCVATQTRCKNTTIALRFTNSSRQIFEITDMQQVAIIHFVPSLQLLQRYSSPKPLSQKSKVNFYTIYLYI